MEIYRLDLDALEEARDKHQSLTIKVSENIDTSYKVITGVRDWYLGEDGITFDTGFTNFTETYTKQLKETLSKAGEALADGLDDAKACKKICNDFIISLGGEGNGKSEADMHGELYCDQSVISELKAACTDAVSPTIPIRKTAQEVKDILDKLEMVKLDASPYTGRIGKGCDEVERLEDHSLELGTYARTAETNDDSFKCALESCLPSDLNGWFWQDYTGGIDAQAETVMKIMNQKELSEEDKETLAENLKIMEEYKDIEGLRKAAEHAGNGEDGEWTAGDIYVMAYICKYAENNADAELATVVYDKMKVVKCDKTINSGRPPYTTFSYEFKLDENKVADILAELDPDKDGLAYYSLQRRSKYYETKIININGADVKDPELDLTIQFTQNESGGLVSVFTVDGEETRLASVDMNKVIGEDGKSSLGKLGYSKEERIALMSSIYTDEDILFIEDLSKASTEDDYREIFQYDPDLLGSAMKVGLYNYSVKLMDSCVKYDENMMVASQDFGQLENYINGLLYKKSYKMELAEDSHHAWNEDYRDEYLKSLITYGEIQLDILRYSMKENYADKKYIRDNLAAFTENAQILSLYATLDDRMHNWHETDNELYAEVSGLELKTENHPRIPDLNLNNMMFSYHETIMENGEPCTNWPVYKKGMEESNIQIIKLTGSSIGDKNDELAYLEKARAASWAVPKAVIDECGVALSVIYKPVSIFMTVKDVISHEAAVSESFHEMKEGKKDIYCKVGGAYIGYKDDGSSMIILLEGQYDANAMLKMSRLEKEGYAEMAGVDRSTEDGTSETLKSNAHKSMLIYDEQLNYMKYLLWTGEVCENEYSEPCEIQTFSDISPNVLSEGLSEFDGNSSNGTEGFRYYDYNIINEYYLGDKEK